MYVIKKIISFYATQIPYLIIVYPKKCIWHNGTLHVCIWVQSLHHAMPDFREGKYWLYMHRAWWYLLGEFSFIYMRHFLAWYPTSPWYQIVVWSLIPKQIDIQVDSHTMRMSSYITKINVVRTSHVYCSDFGLAWFNNPWSFISHHEIMHMQPCINFD